MTTIKCTNMKYDAETMAALLYNRLLTLSLTDTLYLRATITTADWYFDAAFSQTTKDVTVTAGSANYEFNFFADSAAIPVPSSSTKYSIAVTFDWYTDSGYTTLKNSDSHTFELHFFNAGDANFSTQYYDGVLFNGGLGSIKSLITATKYSSNTSWVSPIIEGSGALYGGLTGTNNSMFVQVAGIPSSKFILATYKSQTGTTDPQIQVYINSVQHPTKADSAIHKIYHYTDIDNTIFRLAAPDPQVDPTVKFWIDGFYVFNEL